ncbi:MAG: DUF5667 domain-containing protein [Patescibacteria group bacterium]
MDPLEQQLKSLNSSPASEPDPQWVASARTKLAWTMEYPVQGALPRATPLPRLRFGLRRIWMTVSISLLVVLLLGSGITYAAQGVMPDNILYPVKIASEEVLLGVTKDPVQRTNLELRLANRRVDELQALSQSETLDADIAAELHARYQKHITEVLQALPTIPQDKVQTVTETLSQDTEEHARITQELDVRASSEIKGEIKASVKASLEQMRQFTEETSRAAHYLKEKSNRPTKWKVKVETNTTGEAHVKVETEMGNNEKKEKREIEFRATPGVPLTVTSTWPMIKERREKKNDEETEDQEPSRVRATTTIIFDLDQATTTVPSNTIEQLEKMKRILNKGSFFQFQSDMSAEGGSVEQRVETDIKGQSHIRVDSQEDSQEDDD